MKITLALSMMFSYSAWCNLEISCWGNDCLKNGWTQVDSNNGSFTDYQCYREGCKISGWIAHGNQVRRFYTQCKQADCFTAGWFEIDSITQKIKAEVKCDGLDCLKVGWRTFRDGKILETRCRNGNCANEGWSSQFSSGLFNTFCKNKSCFTEGWFESIR